MSYRTYVEGKQIFGNNEYYQEWFDFLKTQGIEVDEEKSYSGEIKDFQGALRTIENIVMNLEQKYRRYNKTHSKTDCLNSLFDFSSIYDKVNMQDEMYRSNRSNEETLTDMIQRNIDCSYAFMSYQFLQACKDKLNCNKLYVHDYELKEGETIKVSAL